MSTDRQLKVGPDAEKAAADLDGDGNRDPSVPSQSAPSNVPPGDPLETPSRFVRGVGKDRADLLAKLGIQTVGDLLWELPKDLVDMTDVREVDQLEPDRLQTVRGTVVDRDSRPLKAGRTLTAVLLDCRGSYVRGLWFNQPWMLHKFREGDAVLFSGKPSRRAGRWEISNPHPQWIDADDMDSTGGVLPRYRLTEGLRMHEMRKIVRNAVEDFVPGIADQLPLEFRESLKLPSLETALHDVHLPSTKPQYEAARWRLIFDDLLEFQLALAVRRRAWKGQGAAPELPTSPKIDSRIRRLFPFEFTEGQNRAVRDITTDIAKNCAMHRLLQADVGAGKTAIAIYAMLVAIAAGYQAVLMAPTELLAKQHWATIDEILSHSRVNRLLLTAFGTAAKRRAALESVSSGEAQLVVGTQAIIQKDVEFSKLGLVVIDEQHKFGVEQRAHFSKNEVPPHVLVMTATPIPRSLCLTQFGDLDVTTVSDVPPGRQRVVTSRVSGNALEARAWDFVRRQLRSGRQAYVVCPRIEAGDGSLIGAEEVLEQLREGELKEFQIEVVHGQMDRDVQSRIMQQFRDGTIHALVSTTVVEVGVDVPNATIMVIYHAERFGLSQLHQLRGRIARGKFQGYCFLFSDAATDDAQTRLSALEDSSDGFKIAEVDFELRGPGDVLGTRQHGTLPLRVASLIRDAEILNDARAAAFELVATGEFDKPPFAALKSCVFTRFGRLMDLPRSG